MIIHTNYNFILEIKKVFLDNECDLNYYFSLELIISNNLLFFIIIYFHIAYYKITLVSHNYL